MSSGTIGAIAVLCAFIGVVATVLRVWFKVIEIRTLREIRDASGGVEMDHGRK